MKALLVSLPIFAVLVASCGDHVNNSPRGSSGSDAGSIAAGGSSGSDAGSIAAGGSSGSDAGSTAVGGSSGSDVGSTAAGGWSGSDVGSAAAGGSSGGLRPTEHRPQGVACPSQRGPGSSNVVEGCTQDSECTDGMNGRCISPNVLGPMGRSSCSYDTCLSDSDCPANQPCVCRKSAADIAPNYCLRDSACRIDSDCGSGGFCSPSLFYVDSSINASPVSGSGVARSGYFCHTPQDLCLNDSDCDTSICLREQGCGRMVCGYTTQERWDCFSVGFR